MWNQLLALAAVQSERAARRREGRRPQQPADWREGLVVLAILLGLAVIYVLDLLWSQAAF